jgi:hypothetical protein
VVRRSRRLTATARRWRCQTGSPRSRDRVGADTEERLRLEYLVESRFNLPRAGVVTYDADAGFCLRYVRHGELLQVNRGSRGSHNQRGFRLCEKCRLWEPDDDHFKPGADCAPAEDHLVEQIVLTTHGRHDLLLLDVLAPSGADVERFGWSLLYALQAGIATRFGVDASEVGGTLFTHPEQPSAGARLLIFEADEGGIGVLQRLVDASVWAEVCRQALEVLHVRSDGSEEPEASSPPVTNACAPITTSGSMRPSSVGSCCSSSPRAPAA